MLDPTIRKHIENHKIMEKLQYPEAYRDETIVDNYHGVEVRIRKKIIFVNEVYT